MQIALSEEVNCTEHFPFQLAFPAFMKVKKDHNIQHFSVTIALM